MLQEVEKISPTKRKLIINVPVDVIQSETDSMYNELRATANIPGFRQGKVPQAILTKKFGKRVEAQVIEKIVPRYYMEAISEAKIEPVNYPDIDEHIELKPGQPLSFSVTIEVKPEIGEVSYEGIKLEKKTFTVEDEEIDKSINVLRETKALFAVTEEPLKNDDMAIINSEAFIDDEPREELTYKDFPIVIGSADMPQEFSDALIGKKKDDVAEIKMSFEAEHPNKTIAGKEVLFKITVAEAKQKNLPPMDDEFAQSAEAENMDDLKNKIRENLSSRKESQINLEYKKDILDQLISKHDFDIPPSMVSGEIESMIHQEKENAMKRGEALKSDDELKKEYESKARDNVKSVLILETIGKKEKIEANDDDVKKAIEEIAVRNNLKPEEVTKLYSVREGSMDALKSRLFADKVLDFILEKADIQ